MDWLDDPVDARITADSLVLRINEDNLVVLVGGVLVDPVGVEDTEIGAALANTLLSSGLEGALVFELVDTVVGGLACRRKKEYISNNIPSNSVFAESFTYRR